jgi:protein TonB
MARYGGGTTALTYVVQTDGTIGDCRTVISSGLPTLDDFACQSLSRNARFEPALNAQGQAAPVKVADVVHWAFI